MTESTTQPPRRSKKAIVLTVLSCLLPPVNAHFVLTYPGWRGNTLQTTQEFPEGMQWECPCGGIPPNQNTTTTYWPTTGGAVALQPGWFKGHGRSTLWINLLIPSTSSPNTTPVTTPLTIPLTKFRLTSPLGPSNQNPFPGTICLPLIPLSPDQVRDEGQRGIIQVIESHEDSGNGGAYNCVDVVFTSDVALVGELNEGNCFNTSGIVVQGLETQGAGEGEVGKDGLVLEENENGEGRTETGGFCLRKGKPTGDEDDDGDSGGGASTSSSASSSTPAPGPGPSETRPAPAQSSQPEGGGSSRLLAGFGREVGLGLVVLWASLYLYC